MIPVVKKAITDSCNHISGSKAVAWLDRLRTQNETLKNDLNDLQGNHKEQLKLVEQL